MNIPASDVAAYLESIAPLHLQEGYDNSGLRVGTGDEIVKGVVICLDCTEDVVDEAIRLDCNMIISHHPVIFSGIKRITGADQTSRIIRKAIKEDIVLYAIHKNLDNILTNGVNERIAKKLDMKIIGILKPINDKAENSERGAGSIASFSKPLSEVEFLQLLKARMGSKVIKHSALLGESIEKVAI